MPIYSASSSFPGTATSAVIDFGWAPAEGQLIILMAATATATPTFPSGFTIDASYTSLAPYVFIASKVAGYSEPTTYTITGLGSGTGQRGGGFLFVADHPFGAANAEQAASAHHALHTTITADPAGVASKPDSVSIAVFRNNAATIPSSTIAWDGGSAETPDAIDSRNFFDYNILTSAPGDFKAVGNSGTGSNAALSMVIVTYIETPIHLAEAVTATEAVGLTGATNPSTSNTATVTDTVRYYSEQINVNENIGLELITMATSNFFLLFD